MVSGARLGARGGGAMMASSRWGRWSAGSALVLPLLLGALFAGAKDAPEARVGIQSTPLASGVTTGNLDSLGGMALRAAPFRADGRPSGVVYDPARSDAPVADYAPPKPVLALSGLVGGNVPLAVIEGIPGHDGPALLGVGDTLAGLSVRRIREGQVTVTGMDTIWVLTLRGLP